MKVLELNCDLTLVSIASSCNITDYILPHETVMFDNLSVDLYSKGRLAEESLSETMSFREFFKLKVDGNEK